MTNHITYTIELTSENAPKIDAINRLILGADYAAIDAEPVKPADGAKPAEVAKPAETELAEVVVAVSNEVSEKRWKELSAQEPSEITLAEFKTAAKKAKADHGEDFAIAVLKEAGVEVAKTLGRCMSKVNADIYSSIMDSWTSGPQEVEQPDEDLSEDLSEDDDGFDEPDSTPTVTSEAVKTALKAYAKESGRDKAREIMNTHGAVSLSKVDECTPKQLADMFAKLV